MSQSDIEQTRPVRHCEAVTAESADVMPLSGVAIEARGEGVAAEHARRLLQELGARPENDRGQRRTVSVDARSAVRAWADSGAMALTGRAGGPPLVSPGAPAAATGAALALLAALRPPDESSAPPWPGIEVLGERAALFGRGRNAPWSVGGAFRMFPTTHGYLGISLPRQDDFTLLPALVEGEVGGDPWQAVAEWARTCSAEDAAARAQLLGIAAAAVPDTPGMPQDAQFRHRNGRGIVVRPGGVRQPRRAEPVVVDLTALWAGPLCAHLLGRTGAHIVKVESTRRPDGARSGSRDFFDLMHAEHACVAVDLTTAEGVETLQRLIDVADLVLEASRPRALRQLGIDAESAVAGGTNWLSITAYGRTGPWSDRVGFGDDVAAAAGAVVFDGCEVLPCGDALADPVAGVHAAVAAAAVLSSDRAFLVDLSMRDVLAATLRDRVEPHEVVHGPDDLWHVRTADAEFPVAAPRARHAPTVAAALGADTQETLSRWLSG
ncbi:putative CoA-transferase [Nocardia cerradoensis]|uniref:Putative CoA-transferase n=1 Tax=Nocardia cerradoensis TaxID=85688 RepID=A0A231H3K6_9NOCA|nr:CoA transferase [Nocardia cerradoensis]OXR43346.1 putative CoA-transferase [Nocardia cerradoensis]